MNQVAIKSKTQLVQSKPLVLGTGTILGKAVFAEQAMSVLIHFGRFSKIPLAVFHLFLLAYFKTEKYPIEKVIEKCCIYWL